MIKFIYSIILVLFVFPCKSQVLGDYLLPKPQQLNINKGEMTNNMGRLYFPILKNDSRFFDSAKQLSTVFGEYGIDLKLTAGLALNEKALVAISVDRSAFKKDQSYILDISDSEIKIVASDNNGLHYAISTLIQVIEYAKIVGYIPMLKIKDWPDFPNRGIMLDISRDKVLQMDELFSMIKRFSNWKINQLQLYSEHSFAYKNHKIVWEQYSPYTAEDILKIDKFCYDNFIELVPNQNSLGHMERWLEHEEFLPLAELQTINPNGNVRLRERTTLNPLDTKSFDLVKEMYDELLPNFKSKLVNIGGDEPWELGHGQSKLMADSLGKGKLYVDYMKKVLSLLDTKGHEIQMWADIVLQHPESIKDLPKNVQCLIWGYGRKYPFEKNCKIIKKENLPFYVCPGTSTWRSFIGRLPNALENQKNAAINGKKYGAIGFLNTDWGDHGHWQYQVISYPAFIYGAALSWAVDENIDLDVQKQMSMRVLNNNDKLSSLLFELGGLSSIVEKRNFPSFYRVFLNADSLNTHKNIKEVKLEDCLVLNKELNLLKSKLEIAPVNSADESLIKKELILSSRFAIHVTNLTIAKHATLDGSLKQIPYENLLKLKLELQALIADHRELWIKRNRIGGLQHSCDKLEIILKQYKSYL